MEMNFNVLARGKNKIVFATQKKIHIFSPPCNIPYLSW